MILLCHVRISLLTMIYAYELYVELEGEVIRTHEMNMESALQTNDYYHRKIVVLGLMREEMNWIMTEYNNSSSSQSTTMSRAIDFLNNPFVLMLIVNQHHNISHRKVLSIPLGVRDSTLLSHTWSYISRRHIHKSNLILYEPQSLSSGPHARRLHYLHLATSKVRRDYILLYLT
jgi:hypothetical protein